MKPTSRNPIGGLALASALILILQPSTAHAQGTAFTYQGRLESGGAPANGFYDFSAQVYNRATPGEPGDTLVSSTLTLTAVPVTNGLFMLTLDFGAAPFNGEARWLSLAVRTNGGGAFTVLSPRQPITATPYAIFAGNAAAAATATSAQSVSADAVGTDGLKDGAVTSLKIADGTITPADVNAASFGATFWKTDGNAGTTAGTHFVGTTDNQPLEIKVNGQRALRIEPSFSTPNLIGGYSGNSVMAGVVGATIGGGGASGATNRVMDPYGTVGGGYDNQAGDFWGGFLQPYATVGGGFRNTAAGNQSTVGGGGQNFAGADATTIAGGVENFVGSFAGTVGGGRANVAQGAYATVGGGQLNTASADYATIAGGGPSDPSNPTNTNNRVFDNYGTIGGGGQNRAGSDDGDTTSSEFATVGGGWNNAASGAQATVGGGQNNSASDNWATVSGGGGNQASGPFAAIGGGENNTASRAYGAVGGGAYNLASAAYATISGGGPSFPTIPLQSNNRVFDDYGTIGGGGNNHAGSEDSDATNAEFATVGGGEGNRAVARAATIAGGMRNWAQANFATVGGGYLNAAGGVAAAVGGGQGNAAMAFAAAVGGGFQNLVATDRATVAGGYGNYVSGYAATVGGGGSNYASGAYATVAGGYQNIASGQYSSVGGGYSNTVSGLYAAVPGGALNFATDLAFAAGYRAKANHPGAFVWGDYTFADIASTNANSVTFRASGGYRLFSNSGSSVGVYLAPASGSWTSMSDRNAKEDFQPVNVVEVLEKVAALPVTTWRYKSQDPSIRHIGPTAQDFKAAFGVGDSDTGITAVDADGVALAAIQGLNRKLEAKSQELGARSQESESRIQKLEAENAELKQRLCELERLVRAMAARRHGGER